MARRPWFLRLLALAPSISIASSSAVGLGSDITSVVPTCAQPCLLSFLPANYPTVDCGTDFTLPCLCSTPSTSGFTIGEVALQCLYGNTQLGRCDGQDADDSTSTKVYNVCQGQPNALPNTHPTLTATLIIPPSGDPSLLPPSPQTTVSGSSTTASSQTTLSTGTVTSTKTTSGTRTMTSGRTTLGTSTMTSGRTTSSTATMASTQTTSRASTTASSPATLLTTTDMPSNVIPPSSSTASTSMIAPPPSSTPTSTPSSKAKLAPSQIAGISIGLVGAVGLAVCAIFLARRMRRRRDPNFDSEKGLDQDDNSAASFDHLGPRGSRVFRISSPVLRTSRYRPEFGPRPAPPALLRGAQPEVPPQPAYIDRNTIGLAISRPRSWIRPKPSPRLQPPAVSSPGIVEEPVERRSSRLLPPRPSLALNIPRKAVATDASLVQPPPTTNRVSTMTNMTAFADLDSVAAESGQIWRPPPSDPLSATTLYFADSNGNWVLRNGQRQSRAVQIIDDADPRYHVSSTKSPIEKQGVAGVALPGASQPSARSQGLAGWRNSLTSKLYSKPTAIQQTGQTDPSSSNSASKSRKRNSGPMIGRSDSKASVTTIQTTSTGWNDNGATYENDVARLSQLSPVEESPDLPSRRARVNYPKIPGRLDGATIRFVPPPKRPNFEGLPAEQSGPERGDVSPVRESQTPWPYPPPLNPNRSGTRFTSVQESGSGFTPEPPNVEVYPVESPSPTNEIRRPKRPPYLGSPQQSTYERPLQQSIPRTMPQPHSFAEKRTLTPSLPGDADYEQPDIMSERMKSGTSSGTASSATSSLLAKRRGNDKATALVIDPNRSKAKYSRQRDDGERIISPDANSVAPSRGTRPRTPMWQPNLPSTRHGDDLFLNVQ
ncbi:hypothetical protein GGS21DRAFT_390587 [Xylaria nigripes]|nr:hypothetical protein GGS21DRAFT_390587 [Xylaria nigripes]